MFIFMMVDKRVFWSNYLNVLVKFRMKYLTYKNHTTRTNTVHFQHLLNVVHLRNTFRI